MCLEWETQESDAAVRKAASPPTRGTITVMTELDLVAPGRRSKTRRGRQARPHSRALLVAARAFQITYLVAYTSFMALLSQLALFDAGIQWLVTADAIFASILLVRWARRQPR